MLKTMSRCGSMSNRGAGKKVQSIFALVEFVWPRSHRDVRLQSDVMPEFRQQREWAVCATQCNETRSPGKFQVLAECCEML